MLSCVHKGTPYLLALLAVAVAGCGTSAPTSSPVMVRSASCPKGGERSIERLRSTTAHTGALALTRTIWTTICAGDTRTVIKGRPINAALDSARYDPDEICATDAVTPTLVVVRSRTETRRFIVNMGGCPGVVMRGGTELSFTTAGVKQVQAALMTTTG